MSRIYRVIFHRHYEIAEEDLLEWQDDFDTPEQAAEYVAREWLADEMPEFSDNTEDFMSATIERKE